MDGWQKDRWNDGWKNGRTDTQLDGGMAHKMDRHANGQTDKWRDKLTDTGTGRLTKQWTYRHMEGPTDKTDGWTYYYLRQKKRDTLGMI